MQKSPHLVNLLGKTELVFPSPLEHTVVLSQGPPEQICICIQGNPAADITWNLPHHTANVLWSPDTLMFYCNPLLPLELCWKCLCPWQRQIIWTAFSAPLTQISFSKIGWVSFGSSCGWRNSTVSEPKDTVALVNSIILVHLHNKIRGLPSCITHNRWLSLINHGIQGK